MQSELVWDCRCRLGEGPVWDPRDASLYFVDVKGREVLAFTPDGGARRRWPMPQQTGWLVARRAGGWVAGFQHGIVALTLGAEAAHRTLHRLHADEAPRGPVATAPAALRLNEDVASFSRDAEEGRGEGGPTSDLRLNDAKLDPHGHLWFGTLNDRDPAARDGKLYHWDGQTEPQVADRGYQVPNGPTFSFDGRTLFHNDSAERRIYAFDLASDGQLSNKRVLVEFNRYEGYPDGMTTDAAGHLWVAHWGGSRVTQRDPRTGRTLRTIVVPAPHVSSVAFGGPGLTDLYITTARSGVTEGALAQSPLSGSLFVARGVGPGRLAGTIDG